MTWFIVLLACTPRVEPVVGGGTPTGTTSTSSTRTGTTPTGSTSTLTEPAPPELLQVDPAYGLTTGDDRVRLTGRNLGAVHTVRFGGDDDAPIAYQSESELLVQTPRFLAPGLIAVEVESDEGVAVLESAFLVLEDRTGRQGLVGWSQWLGSALDGAGGGEAGVLFVDGAISDAATWYGQPGACTAAAPTAPALSVLDPGLAFARLDTTGQSLELLRDEGAGYPQFLRQLGSREELGGGKAWALVAEQGVLPAFTLEGVATGARFDGLKAPSLTLEGTVTRSQMWEWSPGVGDWLLLVMTRYAYDWWSLAWVPMETQQCLLTNTGSWRMPDTLWTGWADSVSPGYLEVVVGVLKVTEGVALPDGSQAAWTSLDLLAGVVPAE